MTTKNKNRIYLGAAVIVGLLLGWVFFGGDGSEAPDGEKHTHTTEAAVWTCAMHPQIRSEEPGQCPICGMDLIPVEQAASANDPAAVQMSEYAMKLANVQTREVGEEFAQNKLRLNGKIVVDETNSYTQSTHLPGRVEQLLVNFTGEKIRRGDPLAVIYSPEMVTAQQELLQAYAMRETQPELYEATRQKLRNWKVSEQQINRIIENGRPSDRFTIYADVAGVVTEKMVELGDYVERGSPLYQIADLGEVWVLFDLYEQNIGLVEEGDSLTFTVASIPGREFRGTIDFIDPLVDRQTRVATARVKQENASGILKPGMYATGIISEPFEHEQAALTIPESAVLWTGKRSVVYVKKDNDGVPSFVMREVIIGPSLGEAYIVQEGLRPGEEIVVNGTFTVDAAAQLAGKPSMMNPDSIEQGNIQGSGDLRTSLNSANHEFQGLAGEDFLEAIRGTIPVYLKLKNALVASDRKAASDAATALAERVSGITTGDLKGNALGFWEEKRDVLVEHSRALGQSDNIGAQRKDFVYLSEALIRTIASFGAAKGLLYIDYCPMANSDSGAYWLSETAEIRNPYYGSSMLTCGEIVKELN